MTDAATTTDLAAAGPADRAHKTPFFHRILAVGHLRYWVIGAWGLALLTTVPWYWAAAWYVVATLSGVGRTIAETRIQMTDPKRHAQVKLIVATVSGVCWAGAPLLSFFMGGVFGGMLAIALLCAGYTLVFTQMRANSREAMIVSMPYTLTVAVIIASLWGQPGVLTVLAIGPVMALALLIKVVITEIKDNELAAINARQAELIAALEVAGERARAASDAKSNFLAVVSHELRTPMNGVLGAAQLLESTTDLGEAQQNYVSIIRRSGESLLVLLNDILDLTKIEAGRMEVDAAETSMADLVERSVGPFEAQAAAKGLDFEGTRQGDLPHRLTTDALRVAQIVQNLLSNAVKFTPEGKVELTIGGRRIGERRARLDFAVSDSGVGIAAADQSKLFQPFTQVDASSTRGYGGTGLGLSICRKLAQLLGGDIGLTSTQGVGSTVTLTLEVDVESWEATPVAERTGETIAAAAGPLNVLVVEDHPVNRMVLQAWLTSMGHACAMAENGQEALDAADEAAFDIIIMDVNMPVMDGLTATRALRGGDGPNRETPVAVLSASARPEDHASGFAAGADAYVDKPVDFAALARVLAAAPHGREAVRGLPSLSAAA